MEKLIDKSIVEIRENNLQCECIWRNPQNCVSCFTSCSKIIMANNYNVIFPEEIMEMIVKEYAKWYNSELCEAKTKEKWKTDGKDKKKIK